MHSLKHWSLLLGFLRPPVTVEILLLPASRAGPSSAQHP